MATTKATVGGKVTAAQENQSFDLPSPVSTAELALVSITSPTYGTLPNPVTASIVLTRTTLVQVKFSAQFGTGGWGSPTNGGNVAAAYSGVYIEAADDSWALRGFTPGVSSPGHMVRDIVCDAGTLTVSLRAMYTASSGMPMRNFRLQLTPIRPI